MVDGAIESASSSRSRFSSCSSRTRPSDSVLVIEASYKVGNVELTCVFRYDRFDEGILGRVKLRVEIGLLKFCTGRGGT